jgi:guanylate kinase
MPAIYVASNYDIRERSETNMKKRLIILSGPSCVGKSPLLKALQRVHPEISFRMPILYTSRPPRTIETEAVDYYFRSEEDIRSYPPERYIIGQIRQIWQAIDLREMQDLFTNSSLIILEIYPTFGKLLRDHHLMQQLTADFEVRTVFISPASEDEMHALRINMGFRSPEETAAAIMLPKLIGRTQQQGKLITQEVLDDLQTRASMAYEEMQIGENYTYRIVNHDGEDSNNWRYTPPLGDAGATLKRFVIIISK